MCKRIDLTGQHFGYLTVISQEDNDNNGNVVWKCKCRCGNYKTIRASHLTPSKQGYTKSCGCFSKNRLEINKMIARENLRIIQDIQGEGSCHQQ